MKWDDDEIFLDKDINQHSCFQHFFLTRLWGSSKPFQFQSLYMIVILYIWLLKDISVPFMIFFRLWTHSSMTANTNKHSLVSISYTYISYMCSLVWDSTARCFSSFQPSSPFKFWLELWLCLMPIHRDGLLRVNQLSKLKSNTVISWLLAFILLAMVLISSISFLVCAFLLDFTSPFSLWFAAFPFTNCGMLYNVF